jgi:hypothetical protein
MRIKNKLFKAVYIFMISVFFILGFAYTIRGDDSWLISTGTPNDAGTVGLTSIGDLQECAFNVTVGSTVNVSSIALRVWGVTGDLSGGISYLSFRNQQIGDTLPSEILKYNFTASRNTGDLTANTWSNWSFPSPVQFNEGDTFWVVINITGLSGNDKVFGISEWERSDTTQVRYRIAKGIWHNLGTNENAMYQFYTFEYIPPLTVNFTFISQIPQDINSTNAFAQRTNITYNITNVLINSSVSLQYKVNDSLSPLPIYIKSVLQNPPFNISYNSISEGTAYKFSLSDNLIYPASYLNEELAIENTSKNNVLIKGNTIAKITMALTQGLRYTFLEFYASPIGNNNLEIFFCNSTYTTGDISTNGNCIQFYTLSDTATFNHCHTNLSCHFLVPIPMVNGFVGSVRVNSGNYIAFHSLGLGWNLKSAPPISAIAGYFQNSTNMGASYSNITGLSPDFHVHYFGNNSYFYYRACYGLTCSSWRGDRLELAGIPPTSPIITEFTTPIHNLTRIYWAQSFSPNSYNITRYNLEILNLAFNPLFSVNTTNLSYNLNTSIIGDGIYYSKVTAYDSLGQNSFDLSNNFTIDNSPPIISVISPRTDYNDTFSGNTWINFSVSENSACLINNTAFFQNFSNNTFFLFTEHNLTSGFYSILLTCLDTAFNSETKNIFFSKDLVYPWIILKSPLDNFTYLPSQKVIYFNASFLENVGLYNYNISLFCSDDSDFGESEYFNESALISGLYYNYTHAFLTKILPNSTNCRLVYRTCDSHTSVEIRDFEVISEGDSINFKAESLDLTIQSLDGALSTFAEKESDRYTFGFSYQEVQAGREGRIIIPSEINAIIPTVKNYKIISDNIVYLPKSVYKGHFVIADKYWLDFEGQGEVSVSKEDGFYIVSIIESNDVSNFESIGELNCIEREVLFSREPIMAYHPFGIALDTGSLGNMIFLFAFIILYLGLIVAGFYFKNFGLISFGFIIGVILGILLGTLSIYLLLLFVLINSSILIQYMRTNK